METLQASLLKSGSDGSEKTLGDVTFHRFSLAFSMAKYVMNVNVNLRWDFTTSIATSPDSCISAVSMNIVQLGRGPIEFVSSPETRTEGDLLSIKYTRVQQLSPDYLTVYEGMDQSIDIKITTFVFRVAPEPILSLYEFVMTTFVPQQADKTVAPSEREVPHIHDGAADVDVDQNSVEKIRVVLKLAGIQGDALLLLLVAKTDKFLSYFDQ